MGKGFKGMGMPGGMGNIMAQAQKMQRDMEVAQQEVTLLRVDGTSGGGKVKLTLGGDKRLNSLVIDKEIIDPEDSEMLSDLIVAAYNSASEELETQSAAIMSKATGGMKLPF